MKDSLSEFNCGVASTFQIFFFKENLLKKSYLRNKLSQQLIIFPSIKLPFDRMCMHLHCGTV